MVKVSQSFENIRKPTSDSDSAPFIASSEREFYKIKNSAKNAFSRTIFYNLRIILKIDFI